MCYLTYLEFALFPLFSKRKIVLVDGLNVHSYISYKIFRHKDKDTKSFSVWFWWQSGVFITFTRPAVDLDDSRQRTIAVTGERTTFFQEWNQF